MLEWAIDSSNLGSYLLEGGSDAVALWANSESGDAITHPQLRRAVAALARRFTDDGLTKARVGLDLFPSFPAIAAYVALLVTGNTVVLARRVDQPPWPGYLGSAGLDGLLRPTPAGGIGGQAFGQPVEYQVDRDIGADRRAPDDDELRATLAALAVPSDRAAVNLFTSGTTGRPKIVELSHDACIASSEAILRALPIGGDTRTALVLSLAHSFGMSVLHTHLRAGAALYCVERPEFVGDVFQAVTTGGCNTIAGVPTQLRTLTAALHKHPERAVDIDLVLQAGGRMEVSDADALLGALRPGCRLFPMYGQTEAAARIAILDTADRERVPGSVGRPIAGLSVRIADEKGGDLPAGTEGEVLVSGTTVMTGYYEDPAATAEVLRDGWLHTGDFGYFDDEGFLYVTGRRSNFVKIDGERISLEAVEHIVLGACPEILDALARPQPGPAGGLCIALQVRLDGSVDAADPTALGDLTRRVRLAVRGGLGKKAEPTVVEPVDEVAYTPNGKKIRPNVTF